MSCWSHRTDGWRALCAWPSRIAAGPADLCIGKHTHTSMQRAEQTHYLLYQSRPKNNNTVSVNSAHCCRNTCRRQEREMSEQQWKCRGGRENVLGSISSYNASVDDCSCWKLRALYRWSIIRYMWETVKKQECIKQWGDGKRSVN